MHQDADAALAKVASWFQKRECTTCWDHMVALRFPEQTLTSGCDHAQETCVDCVQRWIESEVERKAPPIAIGCTQCESVLDHEKLKQLALPAVFEKYDRANTLHEMSKDPDFYWCLDPARHSGQLHSGGREQPIFRCNECDHRSCIACGVPWHEGQSCATFLEGKADMASIEEVNRSSKPCPACGARIHKIDGCDHMNCIMCGHDFCWVCSADYTLIFGGDNGQHYEGCTYRRERDRLRFEFADPWALDNHRALAW